MKCADCPFLLSCWTGCLGENLIERRSVTLCHACGRMIVHVMGLFEGQRREELKEAHRFSWHYAFFCEQRSTKQNRTMWRSLHTRVTQARRVPIERTVIIEKKELHFRTPVGIGLCYFCREDKHTLPQKWIDLDKEPERIREGLL